MLNVECFGGSAVHSILDCAALTSSPALTNLEVFAIAQTAAKPYQVLQNSVNMYRDHTGFKFLKFKTIVFHVECKKTRHAPKSFKNELPHRHCSTQNQQESWMIWQNLAQRIKCFFCLCDFALDQTRLKFFRLANIIFHFLWEKI